MFTARRKQAYEALHPETVNGQNQHTRVRKDCEPSPEPAADRFTMDTAKRTGKSERAVQLDAARGEKVASDVLDAIRGTAADTGAKTNRSRSSWAADATRGDKVAMGQHPKAGKKPVVFLPAPARRPVQSAWARTRRLRSQLHLSGLIHARRLSGFRRYNMRPAG